MTPRTTRHLPVLTVLVLVLVSAAAPASAQPVYKCVADDGKVTYSQNPCYGEQWHRLGEARAQRKPAPEAAAPVKAPEKAAGNRVTATSPQSTVAGASAPAAATTSSAVAPAAASASTPATATRP